MPRSFTLDPGGAPGSLTAGPPRSFPFYTQIGSALGKAVDDMRVQVPPGQSRSGQARTESCGRHGNAGSEA